MPNLDAAKAKAALEFHDEIRAAVEAHREDPEPTSTTATTSGRSSASSSRPRSRRARDGDRVKLLRVHGGEDPAATAPSRGRRRRRSSSRAPERDLRGRAARLAAERRRRAPAADGDPHAAAVRPRAATARPPSRSGCRSTSTTGSRRRIRSRARPAAGRSGRRAGRGRRGRRDGRGARPAALAAVGDGWYEAELGPLPEGVYRVTRRRRRTWSPSPTSSPWSTRRVNWAVVIGVDRYWSRQASLHGAVRDALAVRDWLVEPDGGNVPAENVRLLLAPAEAADRSSSSEERSSRRRRTTSSSRSTT